MKNENEEVPSIIKNSKSYREGQVLGASVVGQQQRMQQVSIQNQISLQSGLFTQDYMPLRNSNNVYV